MSADNQETVTDYELGGGEQQQQPIKQKRKLYRSPFQETEEDARDISLCGGCCDLRQAVIVGDILNIVYVLLEMSIKLSRAANHQSNNAEAEANDDDDEVDVDYSHFAVAPFLVLQAVRIIATVFGIVGAYRFDFKVFAVCLACFSAEWIIDVVRLDTDHVLTLGFLLYLHLWFGHLLHKGQLSKESYVQPERTCWCVSSSE